MLAIGSRLLCNINEHSLFYINLDCSSQVFLLRGVFYCGHLNRSVNANPNPYRMTYIFNLTYRVSLFRSFFSSVKKTNQKRPRLYPVLPKLALFRLNCSNSPKGSNSEQSGKSEELLPLSPLRTGLASFPASGSGFFKYQDFVIDTGFTTVKFWLCTRLWQSGCNITRLSIWLLPPLHLYLM